MYAPALVHALSEHATVERWNAETVSRVRGTEVLSHDFCTPHPDPGNASFKTEAFPVTGTSQQPKSEDGLDSRCRDSGSRVLGTGGADEANPPVPSDAVARYAGQPHHMEEER